LRLFLRAVESCLRAHSPGAGPAARLAAVAFIHRYGSALNTHLHFHCVVFDGVFASTLIGGVVFRAATAIEAEAITAVQTAVRRQQAAHPADRVVVAMALDPGVSHRDSFTKYAAAYFAKESM
jgi:hypothetical protein